MAVFKYRLKSFEASIYLVKNNIFSGGKAFGIDIVSEDKIVDFKMISIG